MSVSLDRVLRVIDSGLQRTTEASYGTDGQPEMCVRCQRVEPADGDICSGCRAYLLGAGPEPPGIDAEYVLGFPRVTGHVVYAAWSASGQTGVHLQ